MNMLDKVIAAVAPVHGMKRAAARKALKVVNSGYGNYGANLTKKTMRGWRYHGGSAKEDIEDNLNVCASGAGTRTWVSRWQPAP